MRAIARSLVLGAVAGSLLATSPAVAAERCAGEDSVFFVCVTTPSVTLREETYCVYTGGTTCKEVVVPMAGTSGSTDVDCGGQTMFILMCAYVRNLL